jgi:hypothetical protein
MRLVPAFPRSGAAFRRRGLAALVVAVVLVLPGIALASHQFADVPTSSTFHDDIDALYGARIGTGCGGGNYCPNSAVTRGQMAAFLNRGLGRVAYEDVSGTLNDGTATMVGQVTVRASNPSGGTMFVEVKGWADIYSSDTGCPCEVIFWIENEAGDNVSYEAYADLLVPPAEDNDSDVAVAVFGVDVAATGTDETYTAYAQVLLGTAEVNLYGKLVATVVPFDGYGENAVEPDSMTSVDSTSK